MQASQIPVKMPTPFASSAPAANINNPIPVPSQIGITANAASFVDGFPPSTFFAGGNPLGQDFNGILNMITAWSRWKAAGAPVTYDATFSAAIGGYPAGAFILATAVAGAFWLNTVDNNTTNPDTATLIAGSAGGWYLCRIGGTGTTPTRIVSVSSTQTLAFAANETRARIKGNGAGAGGGGSYGTGSAGSGGGAGAYIDAYVTGQSPGNTLAFVVGAPGAAGAATPTAGGAAGSTYITATGAYITMSGATGGSPGSNAIVTTAGAGGSVTASGANLQIVEQFSGQGGGLGYSVGSTAALGGTGGLSPRSGGAGQPNLNAYGFSGPTAGAGGNGGAWGNVGGAGAAASFIVEFYP